MIIDAHTHIVDRGWHHETWWRYVEASFHKNSPSSLFGEKKEGKNIEALFDPDGEKIIKAMEQAGVDVSVVLPLDFGLLLGEPDVSIEEQNRLVSELCKKHHPRLVGFVGVDPRRPNAVEIATYGLKELGLKGIKLNPATGYSPAGAESHGLFETAMEFQVPVLIHTGPAFGPLLSRYCRPLELDEVHTRFPDLCLIAGHLGGSWFEELYWIGSLKENIYTDCSAWQSLAKRNFPEFCAVIRKGIDMMGMRHMLFGTDWPFSASVLKTEKYVHLIKKKLQSPHSQHHFAKAEIKALLGGNAKKILQIGDEQ